MKKKIIEKYIRPEIEIVRFETEDIIVTSGTEDPDEIYINLRD